MREVCRALSGNKFVPVCVVTSSRPYADARLALKLSECVGRCVRVHENTSCVCIAKLWMKVTGVIMAGYEYTHIYTHTKHAYLNLLLGGPSNVFPRLTAWTSLHDTYTV